MKKVPAGKRFSIVPEELMELAKGDEAALNNFIAKDENDNKVIIRITAENVDELLPSLETFNFEVISSSPENHFVEGAIPARRIPGLRTLTDKGILGVLPVYEPITNGGTITSQADFVHESDRVRNSLPNGFDGTGVTVGIMSDSYDNLGGADGDIASGDLPTAGVNVLQELSRGGSDEGRGMAQLVHDLAPGADLAFSSVFISEADFAQQIRDLADPAKGDADVLVDDIIYFAEPFFQDGIIAQAVDEVVTNQGVTYFSSAGNSADKSFESDTINFVADAAIDGQVSYPGTYYDFDTSSAIDPSQSITLDPGQRILLSFQWDDPFYTVDGVDTDLDLFLLDSNGNQVTSAANDNFGSQTPVEILSFTNPGSTTQTYELVISKYFGANPDRLKYVNFGNEPAATEYPNEAGTIYGHSAAVNAQSVAAVPWFDQDNPESFTSKGSTTILFEADGTPKASAEVRNTPDIAAIDGTNTTFFGSDIPNDADGFANFFGTSAAAPHAAAIAALMKEADPSLTPEQVYTQLQSTAEDIHTPGHDDLTGVGLINAYDAIFGSAMTASVDFKDDFEDGNLGIMYETNSTGAGIIEVTGEHNPIDLNHLALHSSADGGSVDSLNEVTLHFDATNINNIQLSFEQKEYNDEDHPMSASFSGSEDSDGVALSVDGINWYSLVSLTDTNSTNTYQNQSFDLSAFANSNGLTLGSDVQVKFQQFDNSNINLDGMAFDNITITGDSIVVPTNGDDSLVGTNRDDMINGLAGDDSIDGLTGNDSIFGANGNDLLLGQDGLDTLRGSGGDDTIFGGADRDLLFGVAHNDVLIGEEGNDRLIGANGNDYLSGKEDNDVLLGGGNDDTLEGGTGRDVLHGNAGEDTFVLLTDLDSIDLDVIRDFSLGTDVLGVSDLSEVEDLSIRNNGGNTASIITGSRGQQIAILAGVTDITMNDLDFVKI